MLYVIENMRQNRFFLIKSVTKATKWKMENNADQMRFAIFFNYFSTTG